MRIFLGDRNIYARKQEHKLVVTSEEKELGERVLAGELGEWRGVSSVFKVNRIFFFLNCCWDLGTCCFVILYTTHSGCK